MTGINVTTLIDQSSHPTRRLDILITVLGILGLALFLGFYDQAFPSAALELELSRDQIARRTTDYMESLGHNLSEYEFALTFDEAWTASVYLQHTLGIPETNNLAHEEDLPLWLWRARWFKPLQKEGFFRNSAKLAFLDKMPGTWAVI